MRDEGCWMKNGACWMEGGWGMAQHELWRSLISGVVSRAAGLILVCPDKGSLLLAQCSIQRERERKTPFPFLPSKEEEKEKKQKKEKKKLPHYPLTQKERESQGERRHPVVPPITPSGIFNSLRSLNVACFFIIYKAIIYIILSYVT